MLWTPQTFHETSIPCGSRVWQVEKYWDERTMLSFLKARQAVLWPFSKPAPFRRNKGGPQAFRRVAWVLKKSTAQDGLEKDEVRIWAEAHAFIKTYTQVQVFCGFLEPVSPQFPNAEIEVAMSSLLTGIFISTRCDHLKISPIGLPMQNFIRHITGASLAANKAISFYPEPTWSQETVNAVSETVVVAGLTKGEWFQMPYAQKSLSEQKYLREKMKSLVEEERAGELAKIKRPRRSFLGRLFKPTIQ